MKVDVNFKGILSQDLYVIRGIAIVLVVLGHIIGYNREYGMRQIYNSDLSALGWLCDFINTFHMPIFFIASGIAFATFSKKDTKFLSFFLSKFEKLIIPLICWSPIYFVFQSLSKGKHFSFLDVIKVIIYPYEIFWFLHALIFATFLSFTCLKIFRLQSVYFTLSIILFVLGFGYWNFFYALGVLSASYLQKLKLILEKLPLYHILLLGSVCIMTMIYSHTMLAVKNIDISRIINGPIAFFFLYIVLNLGTRVLFPKQVEKLVHRTRNYLVYLGTLSMIIYLFHGYFTRSTIILMTKLFHLPNPILYFIVVSFMGVVGPLIIYNFLKDRSQIFMYSIGGAKK
ncbi:MAG: acyltransferase [Iphinoe sp. HA4291-MV1]|jgi:fucose 4-O-acetylase-like acetyltransferase|nr:acyltransferase [Iphinoe sp. HA4291-MV1]